MRSSLDADAPYWAALEAGRVELPRCAQCGVWQWPAVSRCGECGSWNSVWSRIDLLGAVYSWERTHHEFPGTEHFAKPYISVLVEIPSAGGTRLMGMYEAGHAAPSIGMRVRGRVSSVRYLDRTIPSIAWGPAE